MSTSSGHANGRNSTAREAVILGGLRTPFGKRGGHFSGWHPVEMLSFTLKGLIQRTGVDAAEVEDVIGGCVGQVGEQSLNVSRNAWLDAGLPESTPATTVDRQCGSGLQAIQFAAQGVMAGGYDLVVACGVENMTRVPLGSNVSRPSSTPMTPARPRALRRRPVQPGHRRRDDRQASGASSRARSTSTARAATQRAANATAKGWLRQEILPVRSTAPRWTPTRAFDPTPASEKLATLKPAFEGLELLTAGNSSQISDGAAAHAHRLAREGRRARAASRALASSSSARSARTR